MIKVKITIGSTYYGCKSETIEIECFDMKEYNSDEFSTEILNAIFNNCTHYFIDIEEEEIEEEEEEDYDDNYKTN